MSKYQSQINKAKSINVLNKIASPIGVKLGNIKDISKAKNKLTKALVKEQTQIKRDYKKIIQKRENNNFKELKSFNRMRNNLGSIHDTNRYLSKVDGEYQSLAELNEIMWEFKNIKGNVKMNNIKKIAKDKGYTTKEYMSLINSKLSKFDLNTYRPMLEFYGFKNEDIDKMVKEFNNANYKRQDHLLKIINEYAKGKNRYDNLGDYTEHDLARSNFTGFFDAIIKAGRDWNNEFIDEK